MSTTDKLKGAIAKPAQGKKVAMRSSDPIIDRLLSDGFRRQMSLALPKTLTADRLMRIVVTECRKTPALLRCDQQSFFGAVLQCAALGLEPGNALGHCYLLPYGKTCQLIIGYRGMIDLARRSGQITSIYAYAVHQKDTFKYTLGLDPNIEHIPNPDADPGPVTFVYAVAKLVGGGVQFEVMSRAEIEKIRSRSKAGKSGPWVTDWEAMAKKTVIRRLFKYLPVSVEAARAVSVDEKADLGEVITEQDVIDAEYIEKGGEMPPIPEVHEEEPARQDEPEKTEEPAPTQASTRAATQLDPADSPDAGVDADDPWLAGFEAAQQ